MFVVRGSLDSFSFFFVCVSWNKIMGLAFTWSVLLVSSKRKEEEERGGGRMEEEEE